MNGRPATYGPLADRPEGQRTRRAERISRAGLLVAAAMLVLALPTQRRTPEVCLHPAETLARAGRSVEVACRATPAGAEDVVRGPTRLLFGLSIDPNRADLQTLEALPGIGPARALAIVRERDRRPFDALSDLARVPGIGPRTVERLAGLVAVVDTRR